MNFYWPCQETPNSFKQQFPQCNCHPAHSLPAIPTIPQGPYTDPPPSKRPALTPSAPVRSDIIYYLFNRGSCHYRNVGTCALHICSGCHPRIACKAGKPSRSKGSRGSLWLNITHSQIKPTRKMEADCYIFQPQRTLASTMASMGSLPL